MESTWQPVSTLDELQQIVQSGPFPVVLFNHDPFCPISARAYREMRQLLTDVHIIDVASANDLAQTLARQTGIKHESPQVIILVQGQAVWSASHGAITHTAVEQALQQTQSS